MPPVAQLDDISTASFSVGGLSKDSSEGTGRRVQRRRSVGFSGEAVVVHEVDKVSNEIQHDVWFTKDEYDIIKARNSLIVKMKKAGQFKESEDHTFRGLEHKLKSGFKARRAAKYNALNAVLEAQEHQIRKGEDFPELIREAYLEIAKQARELALEIGEQDAFSARGVIPSPHANPACEEETKEASDCEPDNDDNTITSEASQMIRKRAIQRVFGRNRRRSL